MRSAFLAAVFLAAVTTSALADMNNSGCIGNCRQTDNSTTTNNSASSSATSQSSSSSRSSSRSNATSNSGGNSMSSEVNVGGDRYAAQAPNITLTSHGCIGSSSAGFGNSALSIGGGTTEEHRRCTVLEGAKILAALGDPATAKKLVLSIDWIREALGEKPKETEENSRHDFTQMGE